jgi:hypothetical protein
VIRDDPTLEVDGADGHHRETENGVGGEDDVGPEVRGEEAEDEGAHRGEHRRTQGVGHTNSARGTPTATDEHTGHRHQTQSAGWRLAGRAPPPGSIERAALTQAFDEDLQTVPEHESAGGTHPRNEGVHPGTLIHDIAFPADHSGVVATMPSTPYFLAAS